MTIETGALEQSYAKVEATYAKDASTGGEALVATDGIRHLELALTSKKNREASPEKRGTPDEAQSLPRRQTSGFNLSSIMWEPSGTLGTISNVGKFLKAGMGAAHTIAGGLTTTVEAAPAPAAGGCTLTSVLNLAVGDVILLQVTSGGAAHLEATRVKTLVGSAITFDDLTAAPDAPGKAVAGITYQLASNITESLQIDKYYNAGNFKQAVFGAVVDQIQISLDGTKEVGLAIQGPAGQYADSAAGGGTVQVKPVAHTTVGAPASGMVGNFMVGTAAFLVIAAQINLNNALELRNKELGTAWASGIAGRTNRRKITVSITFYLEDTNLIGKAHSVTKGCLRTWVGTDADGKRLAAVLPSVEFEIPEIPAGNGPKEVTIEGTAYATNGNDQLFLAEV